MPFNLKVQVRVSQDDSGDTRQPLTGARLQCCFVEIEEHVGHVDDQSTCRIFRLKHLVQLGQKSLASLLTLCLCLLSGRLSLLNLLAEILLFQQCLLASLFRGCAFLSGSLSSLFGLQPGLIGSLSFLLRLIALLLCGLGLLVG
jgi:hypothetical protein